MSVQQVPVTFLGGYPARKGVLGLIATPDDVGDAAFCRIYTYNQGQWARVQQDFHFTCHSMTYRSDDQSGYKGWWALGIDGEALEIKHGVPSVEQIPGAGFAVSRPYGRLSVIRNIGGELYACGFRRQVYHRKGRWTSIADPILTRQTERGFLDMDGSGHDALYAVGYHGEIFFYDGKRWHADVSPTSEHLTGIRCLGPDDVWACGRHGVVLHGQYNRWQVIQDSAFTDYWWCVEEFGGRMYLACSTGLAYIEGRSIRPVDVGLNRTITANRLHACDGLLWSIGVKDILVFDGKTWQEVVHPDNAWFHSGTGLAATP